MALNPVSIALNVALAPARIALRIASNLIGGTEAPPRPATAKPPRDLDDVTIARKVESVVFRDRKVAKGKVDVNVVDGVVWLRGEVATPERIDRVVAQARAVPEVTSVENLLHLSKAPAPRQARRTRRSPSARKVTPRKVTGEGPTPAKAEPSPRATAATGRGRRPAPLGSQRPESESDGPDVAELDKDPAYNPPPGLRDIKGG